MDYSVEFFFKLKINKKMYNEKRTTRVLQH